MMRGLTLWQPWASAMAFGLKAIETRSWTTNYRGPVALHAAKGPVRLHERLGEVLDAHNERPTLSGWYENPLPAGAVVAVGELVAVLPTRAVLRDESGEAWGWWTDLAVTAPPRELGWGDYGAGRYAWLFTNVRRLEYPVDVRGRQGLWKVDDETARIVQDHVVVA